MTTTGLIIEAVHSATGNSILPSEALDILNYLSDPKHCIGCKYFDTKRCRLFASCMRDGWDHYEEENKNDA